MNVTAIRLVILVAGILAWAPTVLAQKDITDFDRSVDFSKYKTYGWVELDSAPIFRAGEEDPAVMSEQELDQHIRQAIEAALEKKGFKKDTSGSPDFRVSYIASARYDLGNTEYDPGASGYAQMPYGHWRPFYEPSQDARLQRIGTLAIDIVDGQSGKLSWRGTASNAFNKPNPKKIKGIVDKSVNSLMKKFPPKK